VLIPLIHLAAVGLAWRMLVKERRPLRAWHRAQPKHHHAVVHLLPQRLDTLSDRPRPSTAGERVAALTLGLGQFTLGLLDLGDKRRVEAHLHCALRQTRLTDQCLDAALLGFLHIRCPVLSTRSAR